jgi:hypothetical protein
MAKKYFREALEFSDSVGIRRYREQVWLERLDFRSQRYRWGITRANHQSRAL